MNTTTTTTWPARVLEAAKRDPKKSGLLIVLAVLLGFMLMRTLSGTNKPRSASAAPAKAAGSSASTKSDRSRSGNSPPAVRPTTASPALQKWADAPPAPISRNLFAVRLEYFPPDGLRNSAGALASGDDGFWGRLEKSLTLQADQRDKRENQIAHYKAKAAELRLESTMMGPQPKAMVNGELVGEGDVVASFRVLRIEARRIIVEREGIRLEIQMN